MLRVSTRYGSCATTTRTRTAVRLRRPRLIVDPRKPRPLVDLYGPRLGLELDVAAQGAPKTLEHDLEAGKKGGAVSLGLDVDVAEQGAPLTLAMVFRSADGWRHGGPWPF